MTHDDAADGRAWIDWHAAPVALGVIVSTSVVLALLDPQLLEGTLGGVAIGAYVSAVVASLVVVWRTGRSEKWPGVEARWNRLPLLVAIAAAAVAVCVTAFGAPAKEVIVTSELPEAKTLCCNQAPAEPPPTRAVTRLLDMLDDLSAGRAKAAAAAIGRRILDMGGEAASAFATRLATHAADAVAGAVFSGPPDSPSFQCAFEKDRWLVRRDGGADATRRWKVVGKLDCSAR